MDFDLNFIRQGLTYWLILISCLSIHEWAHAFTADRLGDHTPRLQGRVTLNPLAHLDLVGSVILPLVMILLPTPIGLIGWGKPVMVNPRNFRHPVRDDILISMAGPASNLLLCALTAVLGGFALRFAPQLHGLFRSIILVNAGLAIFNLIPIPPLDGSHVLRHLIRMSEETYLQFCRWGFIVLLVLINTPLFQFVIIPMVLVAGFFHRCLLTLAA